MKRRAQLIAANGDVREHVRIEVGNIKTTAAAFGLCAASTFLGFVSGRPKLDTVLRLVCSAIASILGGMVTSPQVAGGAWFFRTVRKWLRSSTFGELFFQELWSC